MRSGEFGTARLFYRLQFHEFHPRVIGIVEIELPLAVSADFGFFRGLPTVLEKLPSDRSNVGHTKCNVVHDADGVMTGVGRYVEHVFEPVGAVRNLHADPAGFAIFHATLPVEMETENILVEMIFGQAIAHNESRMNQPRAGLPGNPARRRGNRLLQERNGMALRISEAEMLNTMFVNRNGIRRESLRNKIAAHLRNIWRSENDRSDKVRGRRGQRGYKLDLLMIVDSQAHGRFRVAGGWISREAERLFIEIPRSRDVRDGYLDARNACNRGALDWFLGSRGGDR